MWRRKSRTRRPQVERKGNDKLGNGWRKSSPLSNKLLSWGVVVESGGFIMRLTDGGKATRLNEQIEKLLKQSLSFGKLLLDACGTRGEILLTNGMVGEAVNEDLEGILKLLENRQVLSIGVYGMGGVGKTTLAKYINNRLVQQSQGRVFWITVSQEFTIRSLQDKIAHRLGVDLSDEDEEAIRAGRLNTFLSQMKNSVLILDDVWENIDMLKVGCTFSLDCCRLIITTRSLEVCHRIGCMKVIQLVKLHRDEAWELFSETLGKEIQVGPQVEEIAKSMAKLCDGLPLAIIIVAGSMKGEMVIHTWSNALAELKDCVAGGQDGMGEVDEVFKVLKYSFDRLNRNQGSESGGFNTIQYCFMYCSLYPEDYAIGREHLVRKFISEELLDERRSRRARVQQGHSILDKLVKLCLLETCVNYENLTSVKMHDLVRAMALKIGDGKYMSARGPLRGIYAPNEQELTQGLEKVSFIESGIHRIGGVSPDCPNLSTLLLWGNRELSVIPNSFFSRMQGLCTLDLCRTDIRMLPNSVSDLASLKAMLLEDCYRLEYVPYLGKLKALRELNLSNTAIKEAPQGLGELLNLRFLSLYAVGLKMLPRGVLLKLEHLQHLNLPLHIQIEEIKTLKQLEKFGGGLKTVDDFNWFITSNGVYEPCYRVQVNSNIIDTLEVKMREVLGGKSNELVLCESNLSDEKVLGQAAAYLTIWKCEGLSKCFVDYLVERFDNPPSLKKLMISECGGLEWILRSNHQRSQFSNTLQQLDLWYLDDLKGVSTSAHVPLLVFSSLRRLTIGYCNKVRKVGLPVSAFPNLECIDIWGCGEIEEIFEEEGEGRVSATFPKLKELRLKELPRLKNVSKATIISNSIEQIYITECPTLINKLPLHMDVPLPCSLKEIEVGREWWESLEWNINNNLPLLLLPWVRFY